jgi:hypothetical protein
MVYKLVRNATQLECMHKSRSTALLLLKGKIMVWINCLIITCKGYQQILALVNAIF